MKSKYETKFSCAPVNKPGIKNVFCGCSRYTTISTSKTIEKNLNNLQKQKMYNTDNRVCLNTPYLKDYINLLLL